MATTDTTALGALLKRLYSPEEIGNLINLEAPVLAQCASEGSAQLGGSGFYFPVRTEANEGHAYISETGDLPAARSSAVLNAVVSPVIQAGVAQVTGLAKAVSSGNAMAFARAFDEQVQTLLSAMAAYREGVFFRDGTGVVSFFDTNPAATAGPHAMVDVSHLREGMFVVPYTAANVISAGAGPFKVILVDWAAKQVTFDAALNADVDAGGKLIMSGSGGTPAAASEPLGVEAALLASGTYLGISRSTSPGWQSSVLTASALLDEDILMRGLTRVTQESGIGRSAQGFKGVLHPNQLDVLFKLAIPRVQYTGGGNFDLGYNGDSSIKFGGVSFVTSYAATQDACYLGDWSKFNTLYTPNGQLHIDSEYNGSALKWVATKDVGLMFVKSYHAFACKNPSRFVKIGSLTKATR